MYKLIPIVLAAAVLLSSLPATAQTDSDADQIQSLITKESPAIVSVKMVLKTQFKMEGQSRDSESQTTVQGSIVSSDGLIMLSSAPFNTEKLMEMLGGSQQSEMSGMNFKITPSDFKVTIGNEEKEYSGFLAATDANLGLAFVKIEDLGDRTLPVIDFSSTTLPTTGEKLYGISRLSKGYDYAPYAEMARVTGAITKPRQAWILAGGVDSGLPVFDSGGGVIGTMTQISSGIQESSSSDDMGLGMIMRLSSGSGTSALDTFLVPSTAVAGVINEAKVQAKTLGADHAKSGSAAETPLAATKPSPPTAGSAAPPAK